MRILTRRYYWGGLLILGGFLLLINQFYDIEIPVFQILLSVLLISAGIELLISHQKNSSGMQDPVDDYSREQTTLFSSGESSVNDNSFPRQFNIIFGSRVLHLENLDLSKGDVFIQVNSIFSDCQVFIPQEINFSFNQNAVFGSTRSPGGGNTSFGQKTTRSKGFTKEKSTLHLEGNAIFGSIRVTSVNN